jgi:signal transduction histidine kinase/CheY-like chemotaxis protein
MEPLRVLLVEDSDDDAFLVERALRGGGFEPAIDRVQSAPEMRAALTGGPFDIVLSDYFVPGFGGDEALRVLRECALDVPFILVSGAAADDVGARSMEAGTGDFVPKQNLARLPPAVRRELGAAAQRRERREAQGSLRFLARTGAVLAESLELEETYAQVAQLALPMLGDAATLHVVDDSGGFERVARAGDEALLAAHVPADKPRQARVVGRVLEIPLCARGRCLGVVSCATRSGAAHLHDGLDDEFGRRAGLAIENARLYREARAAQTRAEESLAHLDAVFAAAPIGLGFIDASRRVGRVNDALAGFMGIDAEASIGVDVENLQTTAPAAAKDALRQVFETREPARVDVAVSLEDGVHYLEVRHFPVHMPDGALLGVGSALVDVTDAARLLVSEQKARASAERAERRAALIVAATRAASSTLDVKEALRRMANVPIPEYADLVSITLHNDDGTLTPAVALSYEPGVAAEQTAIMSTRKLDASADTGVGKVIRTGEVEVYGDLQPGFTGSAPPDALPQALRASPPRSYLCVPLVARRRTIGALALLSRTPHRYGPDEIALFSDLARSTATAIDNAILHEQARNAIHMRDEFLSIASHELKTPLTTMKLQTEHMQRSLGRGEGNTERMGRSLSSTQLQLDRLALLVQNLLEVSRIAAGSLDLVLETLDLVVAARTVIDRFSVEVERAGATVTLQADTPVIGQWDGFKTEQVITNLLHNALKFGASLPVEVVVEDAPGVGRLIVRDHGLGIAPEDLSRLFGRFERAVSNRHYGGLGLGLYISHQIVRAHGGTIEVKSKPGRGATFIVELPKVAQPQRSPLRV